MDNGYKLARQMDLADLELVAHIEHQNARALRIHPAESHICGHPESVGTPDGCLLPVVVSSDVPRGTIDVVPVRPYKPTNARIGPLRSLLMQALDLQKFIRSQK